MTTADSTRLADLLSERKGKDKVITSVENKLFDVGIKANASLPGSATVAGYVRDTKTGEPLPSAALTIDRTTTGVITDQFGYFSLTLAKGRHIIKISSVGMKPTIRQINLYSDGKLNIEMEDFIQSLKGVIVVSDKVSNLKGVQLGLEKIKHQGQSSQMPVAFW